MLWVNLTVRMQLRRFTRVDERILEEIGEFEGDGGRILRVVQLLSGPSDPADDAGHGGGLDGPHLDGSRTTAHEIER